MTYPKSFARFHNPVLTQIVRDQQKADVQRWTRLRGRMTQTVRGSHVDIYVRLYNWSKVLLGVTICLAGVCLVFVVEQVLYALISGRIHQILEAAKVGQ